jgi:hypothetical protein
MKKRLYAAAGALGLACSALALPALARPEIASGDQLLNTDVSGCLSLAENFIAALGVESERGVIDRTGYFDDGSFRILCYRAGDASMAIVFASHETSVDIASSFIQMALDELSNDLDGAANETTGVVPQPVPSPNGTPES